MPHFVSTNMFEDTNTKYHDFYIMDYLVNEKHNNLQILPVWYKNSIFFIRCIKRHNDFLYKIDKLTRPNDLCAIKVVLGFISSKLEVVRHNLNQVNKKHTRGTQTQYFLHEDELETIKPDLIEIGFGSGRHILDLAKSNPTKKVLGFEIHAPSIRQVLNAIEIHKLSNLYICNLDARLGIQAFKSKSVEVIFLHFPVPWNQAKHRRVFSRDFLENSFRVLKNKGYINIRSDDDEYIKDVISESLSAEEAHFEVFKNKDAKIISKYEQRWSKLKKDIYELHIFKHFFDYQHKEKARIEFEFNIKGIKLSDICNKKWIYDTIFINIGDLYCSKPSSTANINMVQIAFGSFYMPFNTYLILENGELHYLKRPLYIKSHIMAHQFLCKILEQSLYVKLKER